jgi:hypothetical protein
VLGGLVGGEEALVAVDGLEEPGPRGTVDEDALGRDEE